MSTIPPHYTDRRRNLAVKLTNDIESHFHGQDLYDPRGGMSFQLIN